MNLEHNDKNATANVCIVVYLANWDKYTQTIQTICNHATVYGFWEGNVWLLVWLKCA